MNKAIAVIAGTLLLVASSVNQQKFARAEVEPDIGSVRDIFDGALFPDKAVRTFSSTEKIFPTRTIKAGEKSYPLPT